MKTGCPEGREKESITLMERTKRSHKALKNCQLGKSGGIRGREQEGGF
jgi:hypothetical protein